MAGRDQRSWRGRSWLRSHQAFALKLLVVITGDFGLHWLNVMTVCLNVFRHRNDSSWSSRAETPQGTRNAGCELSMDWAQEAAAKQPLVVETKCTQIQCFTVIKQPKKSIKATVLMWCFPFWSGGSLLTGSEEEGQRAEGLQEARSWFRQILRAVESKGFTAYQDHS